MKWNRQSGYPQKRQRIAVILGGGALLAALVMAWSHGRCPSPAPPDVQRSGQAKVRDLIAQVRTAPFGQTERGRRLSEALQRQLDQQAIVFSGDMGGPRGQTRFRWFRPPLVYIRAIQVNETTWLHQLPWQLAEALYHEAVHVINGGFRRASFEEECDAFCAGLQAEAAVRGDPAWPARLTIDGLSVATFVRQSYPRAPRQPGYQPIGIDRAWLRQQAGE